MLDLFLSAFVTLFVVIDPPGCAPIYAGLTGGASRAQARSMALRASAIAGVILLIFARPLRRLMGTGEDTSGEAAVEAAPAAREGTLPT